MAEGGVTPEAARNFQKTVVVQKERAADIEPYGFREKLFGKITHGMVEAKYEAGSGGTVSTSIISGNAELLQGWSFNNAGELIAIDVTKHLINSPKEAAIASHVRLERGESGRFQVKESETGSSLFDWEKEFYSAQKRLAEGQKVRMFQGMIVNLAKKYKFKSPPSQK